MRTFALKNSNVSTPCPPTSQGMEHQTISAKDKQLHFQFTNRFAFSPSSCRLEPRQGGPDAKF